MSFEVCNLGLYRNRNDHNRRHQACAESATRRFVSDTHVMRNTIPINPS